MIKKMSIFGISFALLGLAFICESANAGKQICRKSSASVQPFSNSTLLGSASSTFCSNYSSALTGTVWFCNTGYYFTGSSCAILPTGASEDTSSPYTGFLCGSSQYYINRPAPGCVNFDASRNTARSRRSFDNLPGYCPINVTCNW